MSTILLRDRRLLALLMANIFSSVGSGITMIAVPWLIVNRDKGDQIYGYAALILTICLFFLSPYIGVIIDRYARKSLLLLSEIIGFLVVIFFAISGYVTGDINQRIYMV